MRTNPPRAVSADQERPAGPTDPEVTVLAVRTPAGRPVAAFASYSLHYVGGTGPHEVSADYFALFCDRFQQLAGADRQDPPFVAMLANGTSGNVNNVDFANPAGPRRPPYARMREVADRVAQAAHAAYQTIEWKDTVPLTAKLETLEVGVRHPTPDQAAWAKVTVAAKAASGLQREYAARVLQLSRWPDAVPLPLQAVRVGDLAVGGVPCEVFAETGLAFKQKCAFKPALIVSLNNGYYGYLPPPEQVDLGGYETWLGTNLLERTAADKILARLLEMTAALK